MSSPDSDSTPPSPSAANSSSPPADGQERQSTGSDRDSQRQKDALSSQKVPRRRVKTGCLTCRKRRIKCGEEKPTCKNCIKSKRVCEGYIPGMVFRRSAADAATTTYTTMATPYYPPYAQASNAYVHDAGGTLSSDRHASLTTIRPKPPGDEGILYDPIAQHAAIPTYGRTPQGWEHFPPSTAAYPDMRMTNAVDTAPQTDYGASWMSSSDSSYLLAEQVRGMPVVASSAGPTSMGHPSGPPAQTPFIPRTADTRFYHDRSQRQAQPPGGPRVASSDDHSTWSAQYQPYPVYDYGQTPQSGHDTLYPQDRSTRHNFSFQRAPPGSYPPYDDTQPRSLRSTSYSNLYTLSAAKQNDIAQMLDDGAVEVQDDDYYNAPSSDEDDNLLAVQMPNRDLGTLLSIYKAGGQDSASAPFAYLGVLDSYRPERAANPLRNECTARIFGHFISSTAPMLSVFQARSHLAPTLFRESPVPAARQTLWTSTLPMMALHDQALLHAMLALSSLHIARVQGASVTPSLKHYAYSLKKVRAAMGDNTKKRAITTLAAMLILGFYEMMTGAHGSWVTLMKGACELINAIDFAGITQQVFGLAKQLRSGPAMNQRVGSMEGVQAFLDDFQSVDETLLSILVGQTVRYDKTTGTQMPSIVSMTELGRYEILQDMYWWFFKQDVIHGIMAGEHIMLDHSAWTKVPPRTAAGRANAVFGTFDHLMLLMARTTRFAAGDKLRKQQIASPFRRAREFANAGAPPDSIGVAQGTTFIVSPGSSHVPEGYTGTETGEAPQHNDDLADFAEMMRAVTEWTAIRAAYNTLQRALPADFEPLQRGSGLSDELPFPGSALVFRSHDIALFWAYFYLGLMICLRSHPSLPLGVHAAAQGAAKQTAPYVAMIGRIAAGLKMGADSAPADSGLLTAFSDCTLPLFFCGVQLVDAKQRQWTAQILYEIGERSGWASATKCARGLEQVWAKAADKGADAVSQRYSSPVAGKGHASLKSGSREGITEAEADSTGDRHKEGLTSMRELDMLTQAMVDIKLMEISDG